MSEDYAEKYWNNILVKDKGEPSEEDQLNTENIQDFKLVENRIDEITKSAKGEITILFCNVNTLKRKESQSILKFLKPCIDLYYRHYFFHIILPARRNYCQNETNPINYLCTIGHITAILNRSAPHERSMKNLLPCKISL